ncbi:hypothetical protein T484DRAFT_1890153, partial [Baffinella frigidus]
MAGQVVKGGKNVLDERTKRVLEFDVSNAASREDTLGVGAGEGEGGGGGKGGGGGGWRQVNVGVRLLHSPLGDEGFRIKKYVNEASFHHSFHCRGDNVSTPANQRQAKVRKDAHVSHDLHARARGATPRFEPQIQRHQLRDYPTVAPSTAGTGERE